MCSNRYNVIIMYTCTEIAKKIQRSKRTVNKIATKHDLGTWYGNQRVYDDNDLQVFIKRLPPGNPNIKKLRHRTLSGLS